MTLTRPGRPPFDVLEVSTHVELEQLAREFDVSIWEIEDAWDNRPKSFKTLRHAAARAANLKEQRARRLSHDTGAT